MKPDLRPPSHPEGDFFPSGIGLRAPHYDDILIQKPALSFLEAHSENYFNIGSIPFEYLMKCREHYPVSLHGVGLSIGSADGVKDEHLQKLKRLVDRVDPFLVSEHISWSQLGGKAVPDLLPLPMTEETLQIVCANISRAQEVLQRPVLVENPSSYLAFRDSAMTEPDFLAEIARRTGCGLLLDINNIHVSAHNIGFCAYDYLQNLPKGIIGEIHLAGYQVNTVNDQQFYIDAHSQPVYDEAWDLYAAALTRFGDIPTLVEWDRDIPSLERLVQEAKKADQIKTACKGRYSHAA